MVMLLNKLTNPLESCQLKFVGVGEPNADDFGIFTGYAAVFGGVDSFGDTIIKGAFEDTIKDRAHPVRMFNSHNPTRPIGKWLSLEEDEIGLFVQGELTPNHTDAQDVYASMKHGAMDGLSIGFRIPTGGGEDTEDGGRRLTKINLVEISPVSMPADDDARVATIKSEINDIETIRDVEIFLRDVGLSSSTAKAFISRLRPLYQRDVDQELERKEALDAGRKALKAIVDRVTN